MAKIMNGRYTAQTDGDIVVFWIGMRVNKLLAFNKWLPTALAMGTMLRVLYTNPEKGFLGAQPLFSWRSISLIQYWRSFEDLENFARDPSDPHIPTWRRFNKVVGTDGSVGIFHETYIVAAGKSEALYGNMPVFGLAAATAHVPAVGKRETARQRIGGQSEPAVPTPN